MVNWLGFQWPLRFKMMKVTANVIAAGDEGSIIIRTEARAETQFSRYRTFHSASWSRENIMIQKIFMAPFSK